MHAHRNLQFLCHELQLLQGLCLSVKETSLVLVPRSVFQIESQRDMHNFNFLEECLEDLPFLRVKKGKPINPNLCTL